MYTYLNQLIPMNALIGGIFIGIAAAILIIFNARIAGISGIISGALSKPSPANHWRYAFIFGLLVSPLVYQFFFSLPVVENVASLPKLVLAGLLVGLGTQYASGCTSGHGICGLSRFSMRSLVATLSFIGAGMLTVFILKHLGT